MLQQTQVKTVIPFWKRWMTELPTIEAAAKAPSAKIHKLWEGLGYYTRVRNLQKAAQVIAEKHGGKFPQNFDDILALPGIGRYTAGAICSIAFNQPTPILDGNVIRVLTRIFGIEENPKEKTTNAKLWQLAEGLVKCLSLVTRHSPPSCSHLNQSLMELGALICTPRNPQCLICPVKKLCIAFKECRTEELPNLGKREAATARRFMAFVVEHNGKFLVRQRSTGVVNAHLWEFPNAEVGSQLLHLGLPASRRRVTDIFLTEFAGGSPALPGQIFPITAIQPLCTVKHSITRYRITLEAFIVRLEANPVKSGGNWKTPAQMRQLAFTSAHKKVLGALGKRC